MSHTSIFFIDGKEYRVHRNSDYSGNMMIAGYELPAELILCIAGEYVRDKKIQQLEQMNSLKLLESACLSEGREGE